MTSSPIHFGDSASHTNFFARVADQNWAMWLDSCESEHVDSRFDILVFEPLVTLTTINSSTRICVHATGESMTSDDDPLAILANIQQELFLGIDIQENDLPFFGGAVGYFGYDLGREFERLPVIADKDIFAPDMAVGIYVHALVFDRKYKVYHLICQDEQREALTQYLQAAFEQDDAKQEFTLTSPWQSNMTPVEYANKFDRVQEYLLSGDCYQINLAQRFQAQYQGSEIAAYLKLREENKAPFSAFIRADGACVLSISPERFLSVNHGLVQSKPIKGTRPRHQDHKQDLQLSNELQVATKDRAENLMIVDLLRNDISRVCQPGTVVVPKLFDIESFPAVHHLVSTVEGQLKDDQNNTDLLRATFPGGSITGAPKIRAMEIIEELEPHRRSVYCGSIGYLSACGKMDSSITIRTLICENNSIYCWAGGGLVADSNVDSEYQETFDKVSKILPLLG
ncbi:aminodeoxychorismate synthase component I [Thalassotalea atypica]|uniref:aminodeoxychorismate synthase component I n=1 Tax=Thalassotalea atypica TaxID=2054316 RepID=UPI002573BFA1|nr:aminodeoxychorismate synthase component I [Thalassotalea atypica]